MADFNRCISALNKAAGRELSADELQSVFEKLQRTARDLTRGDVKNPRLPKEIRDTLSKKQLVSAEAIYKAAAEIEAKAMIADHQRALANAERQVETIAQRQAEIEAMKKGGIRDTDAVRRLIVNDADGAANQFSLEARTKAMRQLMRSRIVDTWAAMDKSFMDYLQRADKVRLLLEEIRGKDTGDAIAKKGAEAWRKAADEAREWFNERGGKIGHLEDWGAPQHHSQELTARAGSDEWVAFVFDRLDRARYVDVAGNPMSDSDVRKLLEAAWETIATGGATKIEPGKFMGSGAKANRHAEQRQIHFRDADAMIEYWGRFGERTVPDILLGHIDRMSADIALLEHFGPNPEAMFRLLRDGAEKSAKLANPAKADKVDGDLHRLDTVWEYASGKSSPTVNRTVSNAFDVAHNLNVAAKLGSAFWASMIGDKVMFEALGQLNHLPTFQRWYNEVRLLNPANSAERRQLQRQALMLDHMSQSMHRFGEELGKSSLTGKLANGVMQITGMSAVNEWRRGAWALTAMDTLGHIVSRKDFANVGKQDMRLLGSYGITEADWRVWKLARLDDLGHGNNTALTPEAVRAIPDDALRAAGFDDPRTARREATIKLLGALTSESHLAVIEPGWQQRSRMYGGLQRGDIRDELVRSFWQFKAFPMTQFENFIKLGASRETVAGKAAWFSALPVALTFAGAMMIQVQELLAGRDPRPMMKDDLPDWKFWAAAFLKGGTLGIYGDFLFSGGETRQGSGPLEVVAGPTMGTVAELVNLAAKAKRDAEKGETDKTVGRLIQLGKQWTPGQNIWFTKAASDHLIFQQAQEALNPGYLSSMRARYQREYGSDFWWEPGEKAPDRAPNIGRALENR